MWLFSVQSTFCFFSYSRLVTDGTTNLLLGNHTNMLLVYQDVTLQWAAQLPFMPVAVRIANFLWVPRPANQSIWGKLQSSESLWELNHSGTNTVSCGTPGIVTNDIQEGWTCSVVKLPCWFINRELWNGNLKWEITFHNFFALYAYSAGLSALISSECRMVNMIIYINYVHNIKESVKQWPFPLYI